MAEAATLPDLCEPVFQVVCQVSYAARDGLPLDEGAVRMQLERTVGEVRQSIEAQPGGASRFENVRLPLLYFIDFHMVSVFPGWAWMSAGESAIAPGSHMFILIDEALRDPSAESRERLPVLYRCLALGFTGESEGDPARIANLMRDLFARMSEKADPVDPYADRVTPTAMKHTVEKTLEQPVGDLAARWLLGLVAFALAVVVIYFGAYTAFVGDMTEALRAIVRSSSGGA
ncbi:MAG: DotU family type IV/VI secretion system protein [Planctomycetota bacterium]